MYSRLALDVLSFQLYFPAALLFDALLQVAHFRHIVKLFLLDAFEQFHVRGNTALDALRDTTGSFEPVNLIHLSLVSVGAQRGLKRCQLYEPNQRHR